MISVITSTAMVLVLAAAFVWALRKLFGNKKKPQPAPTPEPVDPPENKYGHPIPPVSEIREALTPVKPPYVWESWVEDKMGVDAKMIIQLVGLDGVAGRREVDLFDTSMYMDVTEWWVRLMEINKSGDYGSYKRYTFHKEVVGPIREWSLKLVSDLAEDAQPEVLDYQFGEA